MKLICAWIVILTYYELIKGCLHQFNSNQDISGPYDKNMLWNKNQKQHFLTVFLRRRHWEWQSFCLNVLFAWPKHLKVTWIKKFIAKYFFFFSMIICIINRHIVFFTILCCKWFFSISVFYKDKGEQFWFKKTF